MTGSKHRPSLGSHRVLGDGAGAALISTDGEIDWWCPDRFEAEPALWSILDRHGARWRWAGAEVARWDACPAGPTARTIVRIGGARVHLWDGLVSTGDRTALVRLVRSEGSTVPMTLDLSLGGFECEPRWSPRTHGERRDRFVLSAPPGPLVATPHHWIGIAISTGGLTLSPDEMVALLERAERVDREAMRRITLPRRHPSRATDALRVLRALTDRDSGAPVAAVTTSLPEAPGGERQFDYRFSWLRDSALAVSTATLLGHVRAAGDYLDFLSDLVERVGDHLTPLTTTAGGPIPAEREVPGVAGWADSRPVRVGNAADSQRQLDAVASVIDATCVYVFGGGRLTRRRLDLVEHMATLLAEAPSEPTHGIWEQRRPMWLVSEELARWHGLDRALRILRRRRPWRRRPAWRAARERARRHVEAAWDDRLGHLPQVCDGDDDTPDAATLLAATGRFWSTDDPRLVLHVRSIVASLEEGSFLRRYPAVDDGFAGREHSFVPTSWWAITALALIGDLDEAQRRADDLCATLPPLQPEEWDVTDRTALGNIPLLWSHAESARALFTIERERRRRRFGSVAVGAGQGLRSLRLRLLDERRR